MIFISVIKFWKLLIHGNLIIFLPIIFTYALSARTWMFGWFVVYIQYSTKLGTNSQSKLGKFTYPFAAGQYEEIKIYLSAYEEFSQGEYNYIVIVGWKYPLSIIVRTHCSVSIVRLHVNILNFMA